MTKKIAIPLLNGEVVDPHFGQAKEFTVFEIAGSDARFVEMLRVDGMQHQHGALADLFKLNDIEAVVCGGIGAGMINGLKTVGLEIVSGAAGNVVAVAEAYAKGELESSGGACQNHDKHDHGLLQL